MRTAFRTKSVSDIQATLDEAEGVHGLKRTLNATDLVMLARIRVPALVIEGADTTVPLEGARAWAAALPEGRLVLVPRGGAHAVRREPGSVLSLRA
jgi:pimeloyl-ACP methyl ester carboxylesterase